MLLVIAPALGLMLLLVVGQSAGVSRLGLLECSARRPWAAELTTQGLCLDIGSQDAFLC